MPSRADLRRVAEWTLRAALVLLLAVALWRALHERPAGAQSRRASASALARTLDDATRGGRVGALDVTMDVVPPPAHRAWLAALRGAGVTVRWSGAVPSLAMSAERIREPAAPVRLLLAADTGVAVALSDSAGVLDTLRTSGGGATIEASEVVGAVRARQGSYSATAALPAASERRDVLVLGRAGWESKFVLAALSEAGWRVRARLPAAPGVAVTDAGLLPIDTSRYDVVIALDSSAVDLAPAVARFVAAGGGLVAAGGATTLDALRAIVPARAGARRPGRILLDADSTTRADLPFRPLGALRPDAVPLERQAAGIAAAVRRAGSGRALALGYDESWRWRMLGGANGPAAHRAWWSRTVGLVAPEREVAGGDPGVAGGDGAPAAALVSALGPASSALEATSAGGGDPLPLLLLVLLAAALLAETASRRFRGAR
jgi:hypothetical protein